MGKVVPPKDEGEEIVSLTLRIERRLLKRIDAISHATGRTRTETLAYLLNWAVAEEESSARGKR